jgi:phosphatidylserine/phosphatidylglycerophosphate/cardiolipin synthase-like enzyme
MPHPRIRRWLPRGLLAAFIVAWAATMGWHTGKPLAPGVHVAGEFQEVDTASLRFLADVTSADAFGQRLVNQKIVDATLAIVREAQGFLLLDYFLFNDQGGPNRDTAPPPYRALSSELRQALLERRAADPSLPILVIVDPINLTYGDVLPPELKALQEAGIDVVTANLDPLRDSNAGYSALWRLLLKWWLRPSAHGNLPNPLDGASQPVSAGAYARMLNFKANHRKLIVTRAPTGELRGIVSSANPHDASSAHSNVALELRGPALQALVDSEIALARTAGWQGALPPPLASTSTSSIPVRARSRVATMTEGAILDALLERLDGAGPGAAVDVAMFYLTQRDVVEALIAAAKRGATVRVILDPNKDAFGYEKSGLPNRPVASELLAASNGAIRIRWYRTHGEQFHVKFAQVREGAHVWLTLGSANFTRRNLADYNLEANVVVDTPADGELATAVQTWFDTLWNNRAATGIEYTADAEVYADPSQGRYWLYRLMEGTGLSTF